MSLNTKIIHINTSRSCIDMFFKTVLKGENNNNNSVKNKIADVTIIIME